MDCKLCDQETAQTKRHRAPPAPASPSRAVPSRLPCHLQTVSAPSLALADTLFCSEGKIQIWWDYRPAQHSETKPSGCQAMILPTGNSSLLPALQSQQHGLQQHRPGPKSIKIFRYLSDTQTSKFTFALREQKTALLAGIFLRTSTQLLLWSNTCGPGCVKPGV